MTEEQRQREQAILAYENAGREISQVFEVINSNTGLAAGTLAAVLAVLGAGELFGSGGPQAPLRGGVPRLSSVSLIVLAAAAPLLWRFFIRVVTAYQNLVRFNELQREAWRFLMGERSWSAFSRYVDLYWVEWRSPRTLHALMWDNLKYGFFGIFLVAGAATAWAFVTSEGVISRLVAGGILVAGLVWETVTLESHRRRFFRPPTQCELRELGDLQGLEPEGGLEVRYPSKVRPDPRKESREPVDRRAAERPSNDHPDLYQAGQEFRSAARAEAEQSEREAAQLAMRTRSLAEVVFEAMARGDRIALTVGARTFTGQVTYASGDLVTLEAGGARVDVNLGGPVAVRLVDKGRSGGLGRREGPGSFRGRLLEYEAGRGTIELGSILFRDPLRGTLKVAAQDHVLLEDQAGQEWFIPLAMVGYVTRLSD